MAVQLAVLAAGAAIGFATNLLTSRVSNRRARRDAQAAQIAGWRQDLFNAQGYYAMTQKNNALRTQFAGLNAGNILAIGAMNAGNIRRARDRNVKLLKFQKAEDNRRHINEEVDMVGNIRVGYASSNVSVGSGSSKAVKVAESKEALLDRKYMNEVAKQQILGLYATETERANLVMFAARGNAGIAMANAHYANLIANNEADQMLANARYNLAGVPPIGWRNLTPHTMQQYQAWLAAGGGK